MGGLDTPFMVIQISNGHGGSGLDYQVSSSPEFLILVERAFGWKTRNHVYSYSTTFFWLYYLGVNPFSLLGLSTSFTR